MKQTWRDCSKISFLNYLSGFHLMRKRTQLFFLLSARGSFRGSCFPRGFTPNARHGWPQPKLEHRVYLPFPVRTGDRKKYRKIRTLIHQFCSLVLFGHGRYQALQGFEPPTSRLVARLVSYLLSRRIIWEDNRVACQLFSMRKTAWDFRTI